MKGVIAMPQPIPYCKRCRSVPPIALAGETYELEDSTWHVTWRCEACHVQWTENLPSRPAEKYMREMET